MLDILTESEKETASRWVTEWKGECDKLGSLLIEAIECTSKAGARAICMAGTVAVGEKHFIAIFTMATDGARNLANVYEVCFEAGNQTYLIAKTCEEFMAIVNTAEKKP